MEYFLYFFLLFLLPSFIINANNCKIDSSLELIPSESQDVNFDFKEKECDRFSVKYVININVNIPISEYDSLTFSLIDENLIKPKISFYLSSEASQIYKTDSQSITLKLSDIVPGNYLLRISFNYDQDINNINYRYSFSNYQNKKRFKDNDNYILKLEDKNQELLYEYGLDNNKKVIFKVLSNSINNFKFMYGINNEKKAIDKTFLNGYSLIITEDFFSNVEDKTIKFYFEERNEILYIATSLINNDDKSINDKDNHFDLFISDTSENFNINLQNFKYIFKFTSYTKNIMAKFSYDDDFKENKFEINEESSYYIIDNNNSNYNKVIFHKTGNEEYATLSFDVYKLDDNNNNYYNITRGLPQRNILYSKMIAYFKPYTYSSESKEGVINAHIIKGNPVFYEYKKTNKNLLTDDEKIPDINGYISNNYEINENEPIFTRVECLTQECIFDINMKAIDEITYLKEENKMFSFLNEAKNDKYEIDIKNISDNNYLLINIHYLIKEPKVEIPNLSDINTYKINLIENVLTYNIPISIFNLIKPKNVLIYISTDNQEGIYYGINYEIKEENNNNYYLDNNIVNIIDLKNEHLFSKNIFIKKNNDEKLIINANTFSNDLIFNVEDESQKSENNLIHIELDKSKDNFAFKINKNLQEINEKYINLYIYDLSSEQKILIEEGILYNNKLTKDNKKINYLVYLKKGNEYIINFRKYSNVDVNIEIKNIETKTVNKLSELICFIPKENICKNNICQLEIVFYENNNENIEVGTDFSFQIIKSDYKNEQTYIYLSKNTFISGILEKDKKIIYKGTYEKNDELFIDFLEGEGEAKINIISESIYNQELEFDYYNKKFNIDENICKTTCEFTLTLSLSEKSNTQSKYKYNILLKTETTSYISIPPFETIYGLLKNDNKEHKYSIINLDNFYNYELDCKFCEIIEDEKNGTEIKFTIRLKEEMENINDYYNFRINFYNKNDTILYHLNSVRNHFYCEISKSKPCYYFTYISEYNKVKNLQFLVQNNKNVEIYLKTFDKNSSEKVIYENIHDNNIDYDTNTTNDEIKNYLDFKKEEDDFYILLKIVSLNENKMRINLVHNIFERDSDCIKNNYKDDYIIIDKNMGIEYTNTGEEYNILDVNLLKGEKMEIIYDDNHYYLKNGWKDNINIISSLKEEYKINLNPEPFVSYYRIIKNKKSDINEIRFGKSNYLKYIGQSEKENSNFSFYINLNNINFTSNDLHLNYKFLKIENSYFPDNENVEIFCVDESFIIKEKEGLNNNKGNLLLTNLNEISYYQKDMGAGYNLLNKNSILENLENNKNYLYIKFSNKPSQEFDFVITLTDFSENYDMPQDIYLFMFIKDTTHLKVYATEKGSKRPFLEISHNRLLTIKYDESKIQETKAEGKIFLPLSKGDINVITFENIGKEERIPNLLFKYSFSLNEHNFSYFGLIDNSIKFNDEDKSKKMVSFYQIKSISDYTEYSVIYNILIFDKDYDFDGILEKKKPLGHLIYKEQQFSEEMIEANIMEELGLNFGKLYINILAEAKIKNKEEENYEYILYKYKDIFIKAESIKQDITIREKENISYFNYAENININATIDLEVGDITQYKYIKLILIDIGEKQQLDKFKIYASTKDSFLNVVHDDLYKESEYKSIDSYNNSVLAIPVKNLVKNESLSQLYIQIPCKTTREFSFIYRIEDGRKMEGITIHENTCFDIDLESIGDGTSNLNYRFVYTIKEKKCPLITFTTYEINNNYKVFTIGLENEFLKKSFYNGYSFLFRYSDDYYEYHTFLIVPKITTTVKICHRMIEEEEEKEEEEEEIGEEIRYVFRKISIGENIYSFLSNNKGIIKDCFELEKKDNYNQYMFNYISKTQNMRLIIYKNKKEQENIINLYNETETKFLNNLNYFCIGLRENDEESTETEGEFHGSINFQILGIDNEQNINPPLVQLINGYSVKHTLQPGQMLYYRLNKYIYESESLELYFQDLQGNISIKQYNYENYPSYTVKPDMPEGAQDIGEAFYKNNYYHKINIVDKEDIYNKDKFPVYIVKCNNSSYDNCVYFIGMNNENSILELNAKRKLYINTKEDKTFKLSTDFYSDILLKPKIDPGPWEKGSQKYYFEIHLLKGKLNTSMISLNNSYDLLYNIDKKTYYYTSFAKNSFSVDFYSFPIELPIPNDTFFYITYRILLNENYEGKKIDDIYNMYENEMHYNLLTPLLETFYYYYPEVQFENDIPKEQYIVSISGINSYLTLETQKEIKYHQFQLLNKVTKITCKLENDEKTAQRQCEFIFSFAKLNINTKSIYKKVEFDGFYQYYEMNDNINNVCLYYDLTEEEIKREYILVTIIKDNLENLTIYYGYETYNDPEDFENLLNSTSIIEKNFIYRINLTELMEKNKKKLDQDTKKFLMFRLNSEKNTSFRININIKNNPVHLYIDEIEFGNLKPNEYYYYYFDYMSDRSKGTPEDFEEIFLYEKGHAKMKVALIKNSEYHPYISSDMYDIDFDDEHYKYDVIDSDSENKHINITNNFEAFLFGFRVCIKVYLENNNKDVDVGDYKSFNIYRHTQKEPGFLAKLNTNNLGNIYYNNSEKYLFKTDNLDKIEGNLIVNLDCKNCSLYFHKTEDIYYQMNSSCIFNNWKDYKYQNTLDYKISGEKGYYFFSLSDSSKPKYIEESLPELCKGSCKFVFRLYDYYEYNIQDKNNKTQIIFYSPDVEKIKIYVDLVDESEIGDDPLKYFDLTEKNDQEYNNKLFYNLDINEIKQNKKYLRIQVTSDDDQIFQFIMNKFIKTKTNETLKFSKQIIYLEENGKRNNNDIYTIDEEDLNSYYKFSFGLISGKGNISLTKNISNYTYELDYEYNPSISVILKLNDYSISAQNLDSTKNFTFFINVTKLGENYENIIEQFDYQKKYKLKYYFEEENFDIFPLKFKVAYKKGYRTYLSYKFIDLQKGQKKEENETEDIEDELYNSTISDFDINYDFTKGYTKNNISYLENLYYQDIQRGVLIIDVKEIYNDDYVYLILKKIGDNNDTYNKLLLEVAPVYLSNGNENDEEDEEEIYIPKDAYVQLDLKANKTYNLIFFELDNNYQYMHIDIANTTFFNHTSEDNGCFSGKYQGKYSCIRYNKVQPITLVTQKKVSIFVKYSTRKSDEEFPGFHLDEYIIEHSPEDNSYSYHLNQSNIKTSNKIITNYSLTYFIRLYDYLVFDDNKEVDSIIVKHNANMSFRMICSESRINENYIYYNVDFTTNISNNTYFINVIGAVTYKDSVEYFSYKSIKFRLTEYKEKIFEQKWVIPLVFVLLSFCAIVGYIIYFNIKKYKEKKGKNQESKADILINDGDNVKDMKDVSEEEEDDNKDKEDDDDDEDDDHNENLIKV